MGKPKEYNFGEKKVENINGVDCPVWQTPKYIEAKKKVIETLESEKYKDILSESDFWILVNTYANKTKAMYSGLIISHNGCLKINDTLENKVDPKCFSIDKEGYGNSLVISYVDNEICEYGEVSIKNCKNDYPYAMAYKRCFDRVVLKKCKLAYAGVYSDSEADEFKEQPNEETTPKEKKQEVKKTTAKKDETPIISYRQLLINYCDENGLDTNDIAREYKINSKSKQEEFKAVLEKLEAEQCKQ